ncbi:MULTISPECIES: aspartyl-phosphate phosphatase Spo0E family protein [unclassified Lysinibacillus]|uniref:aspartyl-phosphate phosphatase Spo0E family protein n=1 Tax=unclassified Lysinibacillus TaxID=2636778 RepID=UPI0025559D02|nr:MULTISPECIES: aspartyl-phosphate phosphatase Spo0E family protein [unclassified Lysinibacillus]MDM5246671.1 aspartyl-phosphate phosphatase Spo0E family protein [Lysinibacillus sp. G4S2]
MVNLLLKQMEQTREMMIRSGVENGLRNAKTIQLSRRLDQLMNTYYRQTAFEEEEDQED